MTNEVEADVFRKAAYDPITTYIETHTIILAELFLSAKELISMN